MEIEFIDKNLSRDYHVVIAPMPSLNRCTEGVWSVDDYVQFIEDSQSLL